MKKSNSRRKASSDATLITMNQGQFKRIDNRERLSLTCSEGTLWVTAAGDEMDYVLRAGQSLELQSSTGGILLQSVSEHVEVSLRSA